MSAVESLYSALVRRGDSKKSDLPDQVERDIPRNGLRLVGANTLQSSGDQTVSASTVLPWLFHALGVPAALVGLLVPIRESLSMLPQALLTPWVLTVRRRKWIFVSGALVQSAMVAVMAATAALGRGLAAGITILVALAAFALGRCLCSIASKDVQGRTIPSGERGQITGLATSAAGAVAITLGAAIRVFGGDDLGTTALALLLAAGSAAWVASALLYSRVTEPPEDPSATDGPKGAEKSPDDPGDPPSWFRRTYQLLREDATFRRFVTVRGLLLVSSLAPPFVVTLSVESGTGALAGLGGFILASGVASLLGGRIFGRLADRSSRVLMAVAAFAASLVALGVVALEWLGGVDGGSALGAGLYIAAYFLLTLLHTGVRVGRKTYVIDVASGDLRTTYVAVSNSAMGLILLVVGGISSALATLGIEWALIFLAALGIVGAISGLRMPEVSAGASSS